MVEEETPTSIAQTAFDSIVEAVVGREQRVQAKHPHRRPRLRSDYDLDARFELGLEEFERALKLNPKSSQVLCLCARSLMLQARFVDNSNDLQRRARGLFEAATRGTGLEKYQVFQQWGNSVLDYAYNGEKVEWKRVAMVADALELFERGYNIKPDTAIFVNPIAQDWARALHVQSMANPSWNRRGSSKNRNTER
jgi:tetratricopeptide (TPR) repeat protein